MEREIVNLNADRKRSWFEIISDINEKIFNDSLPISMNFLNKDKI